MSRTNAPGLKKKYSPFRNPLRVTNLQEYKISRRQRCALSALLPVSVLWKWYAPVPAVRGRGAVDQFSDEAITALLVVKLAFGLSYSGTIGLVRDHFRTRHLKTQVPDEATICRRAQRLGALVGRQLSGCPGGFIWLPPQGEGFKRTVCGVVIDSTGLSVRGPGTWRSGRVHGKEKGLGDRRIWLKLHLAVDPVTGQVLAAAATPQTTDDGSIGVALLAALAASGYTLKVIAADGAYDTQDVYGAAVRAGCTQVLVPPRRGAGVWKDTGVQAVPGAEIRNKHWAAVHPMKGEDADGRRSRWKEDVGYHVRSLVESAMWRIAARTGSRCKMRSPEARMAEVHALVALLNTHARLGQPERYRRAWAATWNTATEPQVRMIA